MFRFRAYTTPKRLLKFGATMAAANKLAGAFQKKWADNIVKQMQVYPPIPAGSTYERTFTLRGGWRAEGPSFTVEGLTTRIYNPVRYMPFVQGQWQQPYHEAHGWRNIADYLDREGYRKGVQDVYTRAARSLLA